MTNGSMRNLTRVLTADNTGNAKKDGNQVQVWACNGDAAQQWYGPSASS